MHVFLLVERKLDYNGLAARSDSGKHFQSPHPRLTKTSAKRPSAYALPQTIHAMGGPLASHVDTLLVDWALSMKAAYRRRESGEPFRTRDGLRSAHALQA